VGCIDSLSTHLNISIYPDVMYNIYSVCIASVVYVPIRDFFSLYTYISQLNFQEKFSDVIRSNHLKCAGDREPEVATNIFSYS